MSRHRLFLDSPTQVGKNRITLPPALANYYGNTAQAYVNGRQVESQTGGYALSFDTVDDYVQLPSSFSDAEIVEFTGVYKTDEWVGISKGVANTSYIFSDIIYRKGNYFQYLNRYGSSYRHYILSFTEIVPDYTPIKFNLSTLEVFVNGVSIGTMSINQSTGSNVEWSSITGYNATISKIVYNAAHYYTECKFSDLKFYDSSGLISEYKFNEGSGTTLTDSAGSNDGIIIGATWEFTTEKNSTEAITFTTPTPTRELEIGRGNLELGDIETRYLSYDIADYVDVPTMNMGDTYTIEATFLYTLDSGSITIPVFGKEKIITLEALPSNPWRFCTGNGSSWGTLVNANTTLSINTIYHIAVVVNSNSVSLYLDGESDGSGTVSNNFNTDFYLTRRMNFDNNDYSFAGNIYDFRLWNKALSQSKLNANITGGETDLALWYSDEGTDSVLTDKAGSNDGTITGATWRILTDSELEELGGLKTEEVLHWTPSSDSGYYWVLTEDEIGNTVYVKVAGTWVEGQLFIKVDGSWKQAEPNVKVSGTWK